VPGDPSSSRSVIPCWPMAPAAFSARAVTAAQQWPAGAGPAAGGCGPSVCAWSAAVIDECGEAVEQALQSELEQVLQVEVVIGSGEPFEDGKAARFHD